MLKSTRSFRMLVVFALVVLGAVAVAFSYGKSVASVESDLDAVWQRVQNAGSYAFAADMTQTTAPLPTLANSGRRADNSWPP